MKKLFWSLYAFIERTFFFNLKRKIIGNLGFLFIFPLMGFVLLYHLLDKIPGDNQELSLYVNIIVVGGVLCLLFTLFYMHYLIVRPVRAILATLKNINQSEADLTIRLPAFTFDEFRKISNEYNTFSQHLGELVSQIENHATHAIETTIQVVEKSNSVHQKSDQQHCLSDDILQASQQVNDNISNIAESSDSVLNLNQINLQKAHSSSTELTEIDQQILDINHSLTRFRDTVQGLDENAGNIRNILKMVQEFADQTNLLALNAAIEAARAGDAGRGFAVVADEVRALSGKVADATQKISNFISDMESLVSETQSESSTLLNHSKQANTKISETITTYTEMVRGFDSNTEQLNNIAQALHQLDSIYQQTHTHVTEIASLSKDVKEQIKSMESSSQALQQDTLQTKVLLSRFTH